VQVHGRVGKEENRTGKQNNSEAEKSPQVSLPDKLCRRLAAHSQAEETKIYKSDHSNRKRKGRNMETFEYGKYPF